MTKPDPYRSLATLLRLYAPTRSAEALALDKLHPLELPTDPQPKGNPDDD